MDSIVDMVRSVRAGDRTEFDRLFSALYEELRRLARAQLRRRTPGQTLDTTALIHEAYLRMVDQSRAEWTDRAHFFAYAAQAMRHILVDHARRRNAGKRSGGLVHFSLEDRQIPVDTQSDFVLALDEALARLAQVSQRLAQTVECRFFGGMTEEETAAALDVSDRTVRRDWLKARAWLQTELAGDEGPS
jgi:RNA polymerase sigma factor (TIGR02999 family)